MLIRYFVELPAAPGVVEERLTRSPESWLPGIATDANHHGGELLAEVGFGEHVRVTRRVSIEIGVSIRLGQRVIMPLSWRPAHAAGLFPSLEADIEIAPLGADHTQLAINARYEPPLGLMGKAVDRMILHRVAESTVKDFLDRVSKALIEPEGAMGVPGCMPR